MPDQVTPIDVLKAFRRVGVVTPEDHQAAEPEPRPDDRARYLFPRWYISVLGQLPDGSGPQRVSVHLRAALDLLNAADAKPRAGY